MVQMVTLWKQYIEAKRSSNCSLHLDTVQKMIPLFHASGHFLYAKSAHLYVQDMQDLHNRITLDEFELFTSSDLRSDGRINFEAE